MLVAESDDSAPVFRRNLVVYCSVIVFGAILQIPAATIIERLIGLDVGQVSPVSVWWVQVLIFLYLSHRYYFSKQSTLAIREFKITASTTLHSWKINDANLILDRTKPKHTKFPKGFNISREDVFKRLNDSQDGLFNDENSELRLDNPSFLGDWRFEITPVLKTEIGVRTGDGRFLQYEFSTGRQRWIRFRAYVDTVLTSEQTTEFFVPIVVSSLAGLALLFRRVDPSLLASVMHSCQTT